MELVTGAIAATLLRNRFQLMTRSVLDFRRLMKHVTVVGSMDGTKQGAVFGRERETIK